MQRLKINFNILDGLRGIAALYVVINHCRGHMLIGGSELQQIIPIQEWSIWTKLYYAALQFTSLGTEFVILFFVLSGFSIAHSLSSKSLITDFYKRRLIRLYWPYLLALFWAYITYKIVQSNPLFSLNQSVFESGISTLKNLFYIPNGALIPQFWSLSYEVIFYLIAPFIFINKRKSISAATLLAVLFIVGLFFRPALEIQGYILPKFIFKYGIYFALGIMLYQNYNRFKLLDKLRSKKIFWLSILILFPTMVIFKYKLGEDNLITPILSSILSVILLLNFLTFNIQFKWLTYIGKMSYTLYISHFATIYLTLHILSKLNIINTQQTQEWYIWIIGIFTCLLVSIPLYYIGESPTKHLLIKMRKKSKPSDYS